MAEIDLKEHLKSTTRGAYSNLVNDLKAIPADRQNVSPGGCARSPLVVVAECGAFNDMIADVLTTGSMPDNGLVDDAQRAAYLESFDTEQKALELLAGATEKLIAAFDDLDPKTLGDSTDALLGMQLTRMAIAEIPAMHMSYHDGQLCYVQGMRGDNQVHWK